RGGGRRDSLGRHSVQRPEQRPGPSPLRSGAEPRRREPRRARRAGAFPRLRMALTREDPRSWIPDSTRGGAFPISEIWNPGPRVPSAPDGVRDVGFTVQVEIRSKGSMLEPEDAIQGALDQAIVTATAGALEHFEAPTKKLFRFARRPDRTKQTGINRL